MRTITQIEKELGEARAELENFEIDKDDYEEDYRDMLNEQGPVKVGYLAFEIARIVEKLVPTAYRIGLSDYVDGLDVKDDGDYQAIEERIEELENDLDDAKDEAEGEAEVV